jgi:hypothetical protein
MTPASACAAASAASKASIARTVASADQTASMADEPNRGLSSWTGMDDPAEMAAREA